MREGWTEVLLKRISDVRTGSTPSTKNNSYYENEEMTWYTPSDISEEKLELTNSKRGIDKRFFYENRVNLYPKDSVYLVGIGATLGKVALSREKAYCNQQINVIVFNQKLVYPKFGTYYLFNSYNQIKSLSCLVTLAILNQNKTKQIKVLLPPLSTQITIADYLDKKTVPIASQIALLEKKRDTYSRLKNSLIHKVVIKGLNPDVELKDSGIDWLGEIPKHWEVKRMKDIFIESKLLSNTGCEDLLSVSEYYGVAKRIEKIKEDDEYESRSDSLIGYKICKTGDLVINIMLAWKKGLGVSDCDGIVSPAYAVYKPQRIYSKFFHYLMRADMYIAEFKRHSKGIIDSRLRLYTERFYNISVFVPPLSEQQQIANYLDAQTNKIDDIVSTVNIQIARLQALRKSLINEVVTGERCIV